MTRLFKINLGLLAAGLPLIFASACGNGDMSANEGMEEAGEETQEAAEETGQAVNEAAEETMEATEETAEETVTD